MFSTIQGLLGNRACKQDTPTLIQAQFVGAQTPVGGGGVGDFLLAQGVQIQDTSTVIYEAQISTPGTYIISGYIGIIQEVGTDPLQYLIAPLLFFD